jgi:hypothetical protein
MSMQTLHPLRREKRFRLEWWSPQCLFIKLYQFSSFKQMGES